MHMSCCEAAAIHDVHVSFVENYDVSAVENHAVSTAVEPCACAVAIMKQAL